MKLLKEYENGREFFQNDIVLEEEMRWTMTAAVMG